MEALYYFTLVHLEMMGIEWDYYCGFLFFSAVGE